MDTSTDNPLEDIVLRCLEATDVEAELTRACERHPNDADKLRRVVRRLESFGLTPHQTAPARAIGPFEIRQKLGEGGMGVVYRAWQPTPGREVALKVVRPELLHFDGARMRFEREIEACARLDHPSIIPVYEIGESDGVPWFTMHYVAGCSLRDAIDGLRGRDPSTLSARDLASIVESFAGRETGGTGTVTKPTMFEGSYADAILEVGNQVSAALHHAHVRGVLHRDVKPSNIMLTTDGRAMLVDFGLALAEDQQRLTRSHAPLGSLPYMAPEQLRGNAAMHDPRIDVYALGVTLYESFALENPFLASTAEQTRKHILSRPVPNLRAKNRAAVWELDVVCRKALARDAADRYDDMRCLATDLQNVAQRQPIDARRPGVLLRLKRLTQRRPTPFLALGTGLIVALCASVWMLFSERDAREQIENALYLSHISLAASHLAQGMGTEAMQALASCPDRPRGWEWDHLGLRADASRGGFPSHASTGESLAISPDGRLLVTVGKDALIRVLRIRDRATVREIRCASPVRNVAFSLDGKRIVTSHTDDILRFHDADTGVVLHERTGFALYPTRAGAYIASGSEDGAVTLWDPGTATAIRTERLHDGSIDALAGSHDGAWLASGEGNQVRLWSLPDLRRAGAWHTAQPLLVELAFEPNPPAVLATSSHLTRGFTAVQRFAVEGDLRSWPSQPTGTRVAVAPDGTVAVGSNLVQLVLPQHPGFVKLFGSRSPLSKLAFTPDSRWLFSIGTDGSVRRWSSRGGSGYFLIPTGGSIRRLTTIGAHRVACGSSRGDVVLVDIETRKVVVRRKLEGRIEGLAEIRDGVLAITQAGLATTLAGEQLEVRATEPIAAGRRVDAVTSRADHIWAALDDGQIVTRAGDSWRPFAKVDEPIKAMTAASPERLVIVSKDGTLWVCDSGNPKRVADGIDRPVALAVAGSQAYVSQSNHDVTVFDLASGATLRRWTGLPRPVSGILAIPNSDRIASIDYAGDIDLREASETAAILRHDCSPSMLLAMTGDRDGRWIAAAGLDGRVFVLARDRF